MLTRNVAAALIALASLSLAAQESKPAPQPLSDFTEFVYGVGAKKIVVAAAEKMPEEHYAFRPVDSVRTFGQILGHIADSQYGFCSAVIGEKRESLEVEKTKTTKAELVAALKDAFTYCDAAYGSVNDVTGAETIKFHGGNTPKLGVLTTNIVHTIEHYGNLVTYMRMKGVVPPTSDAEFMKSIRR